MFHVEPTERRRAREVRRLLLSRRFERRCVAVFTLLPIVIYIAYLAGKAFVT